MVACAQQCYCKLPANSPPPCTAWRIQPCPTRSTAHSGRHAATPKRMLNSLDGEQPSSPALPPHTRIQDVD